MKKVFILISFCIIFMVGCELVPKHDIKLRNELFFKCLKNVPKGPQHTVSNDWDEVIIECRRTAWVFSKINR